MSAAGVFAVLSMVAAQADAKDVKTSWAALREVDSRRLDPRIIEHLEEAERVSVIVELHGFAPLRRPAEGWEPGRRSQRRSALAEAKGEVIARVGIEAQHLLHLYPNFPMLAVVVNARTVLRLAFDERVLRVHAEGYARPVSLDATLDAIAAPAFHAAGGRGQGTAVAVLDTPIRYDNGEFGSCPSPGAAGCPVREWLSFVPFTSEEVIAQEDAIDAGSHGSNVAGIVYGVAPEASLLGLNVFLVREGRLLAPQTATLAALDWVADNAERYGIVAANMSLGSGHDGTACNDSPYATPIQYLYAEHGVLSVVASGNDGESNGVRSPACVSAAITVGAIHDRRALPYPRCLQPSPQPFELACFSNVSGLIDLLAPGVSVDAGGYLDYSGTSMAAPHVAGAIGAIQSAVQAARGAPMSAYWLEKRLLTNFATNLRHTDGRWFHRLDLGASRFEGRGFGFGGWFGETAQGALDRERTIELSIPPTEGGEVEDLAMYLSILHPHPEDVEFELVSPSGQAASGRLPRGQSHFTGVLGRGAHGVDLSALFGSEAGGTWRLTLVDRRRRALGHYLDAALFPTIAGGCLVDGRRFAPGESRPERPCEVCEPEVDARRLVLAADACLVDGQCLRAGDRDAGGCFVCRPEVANDHLDRADDACLIDGVCRPSGALHPETRCFVCDPARGTGAWSRAPDTCFVRGMCYDDGEPDAEATCQVCQPNIYTTALVTEEGSCFIDGACYPEGAPHPDRPCLRCDPKSDPSGWILGPGACLVDGRCLTAGEAAPNDDRFVCLPSVATTALTETCVGPSCPEPDVRMHVVGGGCRGTGAPCPSLIVLLVGAEFLRVRRTGRLTDL